ncbi:MAG: metallophosphatase family protein, partial [Planctomycetia bacterium]|nr:metallophosphatase family protein [Planctomycetia bacterium]
MAGKRDIMSERAIQLIRKFPEWPARTLARRLVEESAGALTMEQARSRIRHQLGTNGDKRYRIASCKRPPRQPGETVSMPKSAAEAWGPYTFEVVGLVGVISDVHVPYHSEKALAAAVAYLKDKRIAGLVLNGDICDFYAISRFIKNPAKRNFRRELEQVRQFMAWIRQEFPSIPMVMKAGNHEERWRAWLWQHAPEVSDGPEMGLTAWLHLERHD